MTAEQSCARIDRLREQLNGAAAFLVRDTSNIAWLTAFDDVFDEERAHALLVTNSQVILHTDSRYSAACRAAAQTSGIQVDDERKSHAEWAAQQVSDGELIIEDDIALSEYRALRAAFAPKAENNDTDNVDDVDNTGNTNNADDTVMLRETNGVVNTLRAVKDAGEVTRLKAAQAITDAAFSYIITFMKPGMTEREVQIELNDYMLRHGAAGLAFPSIVATGANGANPHAIPGDTVLEAGQCVVMDFGARAQGYCSDMTRTVFVGEPDAYLRQAYEVLREANEQVSKTLHAGMIGAEAHQMAENILAAGGFEGKMGHGLGHGVGIDIHEQPTLSPRNKQPLEVGHVVTVEPGIYLEGDFGMRLEDFGIITPDGFSVFTQSTHDMVII